MKKIIQICSLTYHVGSVSMDTIAVLTDNGEIWRFESRTPDLDKGGWIQLPPLPEDPEMKMIPET